MGLFRQKTKSDTTSPIHHYPIVTYHITQSLSGRLTVTPSTPDYQSYTITLSRTNSFRDTIDVAVHRHIELTVRRHSDYPPPSDYPRYESSPSEYSPSDYPPPPNYPFSDYPPPPPPPIRPPTARPPTARPPGAISDLVGRCLVEVVRGKFLKFSLGDGTNVSLERRGTRFSNAFYRLAAPAHQGLNWVRDEDTLGGRTSPDRKLKLVDSSTGAVLARFAGAEMGVTEFGLLEIYENRVAQDTDWCGLLVLSAVSVYAREERNREKNKKTNDVAGFIGNWGGLLTLGAPGP